jgi:hypothetical protein
VRDLTLSSSQGWLNKAVRIDSPAPLPEDPKSALLEEMLTVVPYKVPEKKEKKKTAKREVREGLRLRGPPDTKSGETQAPSAYEEGQEEEGEESDSSRPRKRAASEDAEEEQPTHAPKKQRRAKLVLLDESLDSDNESVASEEVPQRKLRMKPPAQRYESEDFLSVCSISLLLIGCVHFILQPAARPPH